MNHPHCVFVFSAAEIGDHPVIAMELMQGTLADRLTAEGPLPPDAAVDVALQLVAGLQAAAQAGILHRDVKQSNCFVDADGVVKIGDFGISRSLRPAEETALSTRNRLAATPTYASPEQLRGATLDARADIYSLGATLYELVTGRRPFTAPDGTVVDDAGRVTELTAKPLFGIFYPELCGFGQPLAGEVAARRDLLRAIPFCTGYAVETA